MPAFITMGTFALMTESDSNVDFHSCSIACIHIIIGNLQNENNAVAPILTYA